MSEYLIRLDDASEYMDLDKWKQMENLLDKYQIKPIFGIIPDNQDSSLVMRYERNSGFWELVSDWIGKGWIPAMHGYEHRYVTTDGGINPVNKQSEFGGLPYEEQAEKIRNGWKKLLEHEIKPEVFFAPSHTFDNNTLKAIEAETPIRVISDTIAWDVYKEGKFWFVPQQSGRVRTLPFKTVTFCYHPNTMDDRAYNILERFIKKNKSKFKQMNLQSVTETKRKRTLTDRLLRTLYFAIRK